MRVWKPMWPALPIVGGAGLLVALALIRDGNPAADTGGGRADFGSRQDSAPGDPPREVPRAGRSADASSDAIVRDCPERPAQLSDRAKFSLLDLLDEYLAERGLGVDLIAEYAGLIRGDSPFFDDPKAIRFSGRRPTVREHVAKLVLQRIREGEPNDPDTARRLFEAVLIRAETMVAEGGFGGPLGHECIVGLARLSEESGSAEDVAALIRRHLHHPGVGRMLVAFPAGHAASPQALVDALWDAFKQSDSADVRRDAAAALAARMRDNGEIKRTFLHSYWEYDEDIRSAIARGVRRCYPKDEQAVEFARTNVRAERSEGIRSTLISFLADNPQTTDTAELNMIRAWLASNAAAVRMSCIEYLARKGGEQDIVRLESMARSDPNEEVRRRAVSAVVSLRERRK